MAARAGQNRAGKHQSINPRPKGMPWKRAQHSFFGCRTMRKQNAPGQPRGNFPPALEEAGRLFQHVSLRNPPGSVSRLNQRHRIFQHYGTFCTPERVETCSPKQIRCGLSSPGEGNADLNGNFSLARCPAQKLKIQGGKLKPRRHQTTVSAKVRRAGVFRSQWESPACRAAFSPGCAGNPALAMA